MDYNANLAITLALHNRHSLPDRLHFASELWEGERCLGPTHQHTRTITCVHTSTCMYRNIGISLSFYFTRLHLHTQTHSLSGWSCSYGNDRSSGESGESYWHFWLTEHTSPALQNVSSKRSFDSSVHVVCVWMCERNSHYTRDRTEKSSLSINNHPGHDLYPSSGCKR